MGSGFAFSSLMEFGKERTPMAQKRIRPLSRVFLSVLISAQIGLEPLLSHAAATGPMPPVAVRPLQAVDRGQKEMDPIWQQFVEGPDTHFSLEFSPEDPAIDQDPFFLRAQSWSRGSTQFKDLASMKSAQGVQIAIPNTTATLNLNLPLTPFHASPEFIFLSADAQSTLFEKAAGSKEAPGEGFFFISRRDLVALALENKPVPVHFFPLSGHSWKGALQALELPQTDHLVIANQSESVAIELQDIETLMKAQQINLVLAASLTAKNRAGRRGDGTAIAPGMTAAFGLFFTGLDLEQPEKSLWKSTRSAAFMLEHPFVSAALKKMSRFFALPSPSEAQALELSPEVIARVVYVGTILTGMLAASVVLKYAHPGIRKKLASLRENKNPKNPLKVLGREIKESFDVFAHMTTTSAQFASVTFANALELFLDRWAPAAAADHTLVRRFLNNSFYFTRNSVRNTPVNAKTFFLGAMVMGNVDTAMVVVQYTVAVPWMAHEVAPYLPPSMQARIEHTFDPNNPNTAKLVVQDSVRNELASIQSGASSFSMESRQQVIEVITKEVETSMKARGLDPLNPQNQTLKEREIEEKINLAMKQRGLPGSEQFLFDASTLFNKLPQALGYRAPEDLAAKESFLLASRFGLSKNALNKAIAAAKAWVQAEGSAPAQEAVAILQETSRTMGFLTNGLKNGAAGLKAARQVRQQLTLLSYEGPVKYAVKYVPETWTQTYSPEGAQAASLLFRQALYSYLLKEGDSLIMASEKDVSQFAQKAKENVQEAMKKEHPELAALTDREFNTGLSEKFRLEYKLRLQIEINDLARAQESTLKAAAYTPPKKDFLARRQERKAEREAEEKLAAYLKSSGGQNASEVQIQQWKKAYYRDALARQIGLHLESKEKAQAQGREDYLRMIAFVEKRAEETTETSLQQDAGLKAYFENLGAVEREKLKLSLYANHFFAAYKEATTDLEMVSPLDPAQPGRFQKIRQTEVVRQSAFLTRSLRTLESFADDQAGLKTGFFASLTRNVPLFQDLWNSHRRLIKTILPALTVSYAWSYFAWQVHMPFASFAMLVLTSAATISTPSTWLNRAFRMNGIKAMGGVMSKIAYALPYSWVTFLGMFPIMMYSADFAGLLNDYVREPILGVFGQIPAKTWLEIAAATGFVGAAAKLSGKTNFKEKASSLKQGLFPKTPASGGLRCQDVFL